MTTDEIKNYLSEQHLLDNARVSLLGRGEANSNYLAENGDRKYVVRIARDDIPQVSRFETERHFMLFIESLGIMFAPRSIHYDATQGLHIVSFVEGRDLSVADLDETQMRVFVDQLKLLDRITYDQYLAWCHKSEQTPRSPHPLAARNKINIEDRLQTIRSFAKIDPLARKVQEWAEPKVDLLYAAQQQATLKITFLHDDLRWNEGGGNIRAAEDKVSFIDWELSGFFEAPIEIGDVLGSIPSIITDKNVAGRLYRAYAMNEVDIAQLNISIKYGVLWGRLGNPLWAAERYCILKDERHPEIERYENLAELGMKDATFFFEHPFDRWYL